MNERSLVIWVTGGAILAAAAAWLLTSDSGQAKLGAHLDLALGSHQGRALPTEDAPIRTGLSVGAWNAHTPPGSKLSGICGRHPRSTSPNMSLLMARGQDWMFCPPSEGDL